jgi:ribosomal-protein-alanine N-acetyltransferase
MFTQTKGVFLISPHDAEAIQALLSDSAIAATTRLPHPYPENGARDFIAAQEKERLEGTAYVFTIKDGKELVGACGLHGIEGDQARELGFWIGRPYWGKGYATFGVKMVLQFAFKNLRLDRIGSCALQSNAASRRVLEKSGFRLISVGPHHDPGLKRPDEHVAVYEITHAEWLDSVNSPALSSLHPALRAILAAELAAGNEIAETGGGWPDKDSVFIRLKHPFKTPHSPLHAGVIYTEPNDPHWWKADFSAGKPPHILAC